MTDEELQDSVEKGKAEPTLDHHAYNRVFAALRREPAYNLSADFADRVANRLQAKSVKSHDLFWFCAGVVSMVMAMGVAIALTGFKLNWGVPQFISSYQGLVIFGVFFILLLHWFDKKIMKRLA